MRAASIAFVLGFFAAALRFPAQSGWIYIAFFLVLFEVLFVTIPLFWSSRVAPEKIQQMWPHLSDAEILLVRKYQFHFAFPMTSRKYSAICALLALASFPMAAVLAYHKEWIQAVIIGANYFALGPLSHWLSPHNGLRILAEKHPAGIAELHAYEEAMDKIFRRQ